MNTIAAAQTGTERRITHADWAEIRNTTMAAHEIPALFESVAENADTSEDHDEFEDEAGAPIGAYSSPLALWAMKTGQYTPTGATKRGLWSRIKWGVIAAACEDRGIETRRPEGVYLHPQIDFMSSRIDMEGTPDGGQTWLPIVAYNVAGTMTDSWRNAIGEWVVPEHVLLEAHHHMAVHDTHQVYVVALFGGVTVRFFVVERDEELILDLIETVRSFWACVENGHQPNHRGAKDAQILSNLGSKVNPDTAVVDKRNDQAFLALLAVKNAKSAEKNALDKEIKEINAKIAAQMAGVGSAIISDTKQIAWSFTEAKEVTYQRAASSRLIEKKISDKAAGAMLADLVG